MAKKDIEEGFEKIVKTIKIRIKDRKGSYNYLQSLALSSDIVWNYCAEISKEAILRRYAGLEEKHYLTKGEKRYLFDKKSDKFTKKINNISGFSLINLTCGNSKIIQISSQTIQELSNLFSVRYNSYVENSIGDNFLKDNIINPLYEDTEFKDYCQFVIKNILKEYYQLTGQLAQEKYSSISDFMTRDFFISDVIEKHKPRQIKTKGKWFKNLTDKEKKDIQKSQRLRVFLEYFEKCIKPRYTSPENLKKSPLDKPRDVFLKKHKERFEYTTILRNQKKELKKKIIDEKSKKERSLLKKELKKINYQLNMYSKKYRYSRGWIAFKSAQIKINKKDCSVNFGKNTEFILFENIRKRLPDGSKIGAGTIQQDGFGNWWFCLSFSVISEKKQKTGDVVGVDSSMSEQISFSDGNSFVMPKTNEDPFMIIYSGKKISLFERLAIAQKAGKKKQITKINQKIKNIRNRIQMDDARSKVKEYSVIYIPKNRDYKKALDKSKGNKKHINMKESVNMATYQYIQTMIYKGKDLGCSVIEVGKKTHPLVFKSTCHGCGKKHDHKEIDFKKDGKWMCSNCGSINYTSINSALNVKKTGEEESKAI